MLTRIILSPGTIGLNHDWTIPYYPDQILQQAAFVRSILGIQEFGVNEWHYVGYWGYFFQFVFAAAGFGGDAVSKSFIVVFLGISGLGMYYLCRVYGLGYLPSLLSGLLYMLAPMPFNRIVSGHIYHLFAYAFVPFTLAGYVLAVRAKKLEVALRSALACGLALILTSTQLQVGFFAVALCLLIGLFELGRNLSIAKLARILIGTVLPLMMVVVAYFPWIVLTLSGRRELAAGLTIFPQTWLLGQFELTDIASNMQLHFNLLPYAKQAHEGYIEPVWRLTAFIILLIAFSAFAFRRTNRSDSMSWTTVALLFIFLAGGSFSPFWKEIWIFLHTYGVVITPFIGEMENLMYAPTVAVALLFGMSSDSVLSARSGTVLKIASFIRPISKKNVVTTLLVFLLLGYAYPHVEGYQYYLQTYNPDPSYRRVYDWLDKDPQQFRIIWVPPFGDYGLTYRGLKMAGIDPMVSFTPKPSFPQTVGGLMIWGSAYAEGAMAQSRFTIVSLYEQRTQYLGYILGTLEIKYLIMRNDAESVILPQLGYPDYQARSAEVVSNQKDLRMLTRLGNMSVFVNDNHRDLVYASCPTDTALVAGDLSTIVSQSYVAFETAASRKMKSFIFASQLQRNELEFTQQSVPNVVVSSSDLRDLIYSVLRPENRVYGSRTSGWANLYWPQEWAVAAQPIAAMVSGSVLANAGATMKIPLEVLAEDYYAIWLKIYRGDESQAISFSIDGEKLQEIVTHDSGAGRFVWTKLSPIRLSKGHHELEAQAKGRLEAISLMAFHPEQEEGRLTGLLTDYLANKQFLVLQEAERVDSGADWAVAQVGAKASHGLALNSTRTPARVTYPLYLPSDGEYQFFIRAKAFQKTKLQVSLHTATRQNVTVEWLPTQDFAWQAITFPSASAGWNNLTIGVPSGGISLDLIAARRTIEPEIFIECSDHLQVSKSDPTRYQIVLNSSSPLFVVRGTAYTPRWLLSDESVNPISIVVNGFQHGYYVNKTGPTHLTLTYPRQQIFEQLWYVPPVFYSVIAIALVYSRRWHD